MLDEPSPRCDAVVEQALNFSARLVHGHLIQEFGKGDPIIGQKPHKVRR
jgi:hypothetical protein